VRRGITLFAIAAIATGLAGCGDDNATQVPQRLESQETRVVDAATAAIRAYCRKVGLALAGRRDRPTADDELRVFDAVDRLIAIAQKKPDAPYRRSSTPRDVIADSAEDLDGTNCSNALVRRLEKGLAVLPQA
jgi:hypothetical protein